MSAQLLAALRADQYLNVDVKLLNGWDRISTHSYRNATPVAQPFPFFLFAPGLGMSRASYTTLAEELASRGIIVAMADHPYCGLSVYPDGKLRAYTAIKRKAEELVQDIADDQSFLLQELSKATPFGLKIDWSRVVVGGHSIGGAAALQTGRGNATIKGAIDLDGDVWGDVEASGTRKPFLTLLNRPGLPVQIPLGMQKERTEEWESVLAKSDVTARVITIGPAYHFTFSDVPFLLPLRVLRESGATMDPMRSRSVIARLIESYIKSDRGKFDKVAASIDEAQVLLRKDR
ncbi:MAG: alpha/beta fold hydrolase [Armatimonadetes bacterium]|nr:alpha/beta fold hydrolase [Armatimonadota bacterium]